MQFSNDEKAIIAAAMLNIDEAWDDKTVKDIKKKIKLYCLTKTGDQCCYCRTDFTNEFMMVMDIEHVLPKSVYGEFMFELFNLSVSCKRCNMRIKNDHMHHVRDTATVRQHPQDTNQYLISHPNLDNYFQHMGHIMTVANGVKIIKYNPVTDKGRFTYTFFELDKREADTFNEAQGLPPTEIPYSENIPPEIINETKILLDSLLKPAVATVAPAP